MANRFIKHLMFLSNLWPTRKKKRKKKQEMRLNAFFPRIKHSNRCTNRSFMCRFVWRWMIHAIGRFLATINIVWFVRLAWWWWNEYDNYHVAMNRHDATLGLHSIPLWNSVLRFSLKNRSTENKESQPHRTKENKTKQNSSKSRESVVKSIWKKKLPI